MKCNPKTIILTALFLFVLVLPLLVFANGGDQRVVEGKYLINLSRAPFTPRVGVKTAFLPSFFDIEKNKLITEDLIVKVRIAKLGGADKRTFIFEQDNIQVHGGVLENLSYIFKEPGLHEVFFDFAFAADPQKIYQAPDFLLDVQRPVSGYSINQVLIAVSGSFIAGLFAGWLIKRFPN